MLLVFGTESYGAVSDDVYVRKDVFEVYMQNINSKFDIIMEELKEQRKTMNEISDKLTVLSGRIDSVNASLSERISGVNASLSERIDGLNASLSERIDGLNASLSERIDGLNASLSGRIDGLDKRIDGVNASLSGRIDGLDKRIDEVNASLSGRIDDLRNGIYLWLVAIGLIVSWPKAKEVAQKWGRVTPSITLDDVRRLIEENNAKLAGKPQV